MRRFELKKYGKSNMISLEVGSYMEGNLAIMMNVWEGKLSEPWNVLTVNLMGIRDKNCAFIDTNNNGQEILAWIVRNGLAVPTGSYGSSGYCAYPEYRFREDALRECDPEGYEEYLKVRTDNQIKTA
ncbi:MAG: DUF4313 domain-containing protein [Monoglobales bacterium]